MRARDMNGVTLGPLKGDPAEGTPVRFTSLSAERLDQADRIGKACDEQERSV